MSNYMEIRKKLEERGYQLHSTNPNHLRATFVKYDSNYPSNTIGLEVFVDTDEFILSHVIKFSMFTITSGKCGSLMNDEHFERLEKKLVRHIVSINFNNELV